MNDNLIKKKNQMVNQFSLLSVFIFQKEEKDSKTTERTMERKVRNQKNGLGKKKLGDGRRRKKMLKEKF